MFFVTLLYPLMLTRYVVPTTDPFIQGVYDAGYYVVAGTVIWLLVYAFRRVEQNEFGLQSQMEEKSVAMAQNEAEQKAELDRVRKKQRAELME